MISKFSEFQFATSVIAELTRTKSKTYSFKFPTPFEEAELGYDAKISYAIPLYLQFKRSDKLTRSNAKYNADGTYSVPYFRFPLSTNMGKNPAKRDSQHNILVDLAKKNKVNYCAPMFISDTDFDSYYTANCICENSLFLDIKGLMKYPIDEEHEVVFKNKLNFKIFSDNPVMYERDSSYQFLIRSLQEQQSLSIKEIIKKTYLVLKDNNIDISEQCSINELQSILNSNGIILLLYMNEK